MIKKKPKIIGWGRAFLRGEGGGAPHPPIPQQAHMTFLIGPTSLKVQFLAHSEVGIIKHLF